MRVAFITKNMDGKGGTELHGRHAVEALRAAGVTVHTYTQPHGPLLFNHQPLEAIEGPAIGLEWAPSTLWAHAHSLPQLARHVAAHADVAWAYGMPQLDLVRALSPLLPVMLSLHVMDFTCPAGTRHLPQTGALCTARPGLNCLRVDATQHCLTDAQGQPYPLRQRLLVPLRSGLSLEIARAADLLLFNSHGAANHVVDVLGPLTCASAVVCPPLKRATAPQALRDVSLLAYVGRLAVFKGVLDAVEVLAQMPAHVRLEVAGTGPAQDAMAQRAAHLGVANRVLFRGWLDGDAVADLMARAACTLVPSRWFETFGLVGPQAIQLGCPVAAYAAGGIVDWCTPPWGTAVAVGDVRALAAATQGWLQNMSMGLDTSGWADAAHRCWGAPRYTDQVLRALEQTAAARH